MTRARQAENWNHTSALLAMLVNVNRDPKKGRAAKPGDFHPLQQTPPRREVLPKGDIRMLKAVFVDQKCP